LPEKKERLDPGNAKRLGINPRRRRNFILFSDFLANPIFKAQEFSKTNFALAKLNIYYGELVCQDSNTGSHNNFQAPDTQGLF
jgi:hypothetical protein